MLKPHGVVCFTRPRQKLTKSPLFFKLPQAPLSGGHCAIFCDAYTSPSDEPMAELSSQSARPMHAITVGGRSSVAVLGGHLDSMAFRRTPRGPNAHQRVVWCGCSGAHVS